MRTLIIRNVPDETILKLNNFASSKKMSREEYLRLQLELLTTSPFLHEKDDKYKTLVNQVCDFIEFQNKRYEELFNRIEKLISDMMSPLS